MTKLCKCTNYCDRSGMSEDSSYGWFCPCIPKEIGGESVFICKLTLEKNRGTGKTYRQILHAPRDAVYVWCNERLDYPKHLAKYLYRTDIKFVPLNNMIEYRLRGMNKNLIVVDHACYDINDLGLINKLDECLAIINAF